MNGFSLIEMMIAILILSIISAGVIGYYINLKRVTTTQDLSTTVDDNLRLGLASLTSSLHGAGYGVPTSNLSSWVNWVPGFNANPLFTDGGASPDTLSIASCTGKPVAHLSTDAASGSLTLTLADDNAPFDDIPNDITDDFEIARNRQLIYIDGETSALITLIIGTTQIRIDTDPVATGNQVTTRSYKSGTPICRVDVVTYSVDTTKKQLIRGDNQGSPINTVADNITDLQIALIASGIKPAYTITLTASSSRPEPTTNSYITRRLTTTISLRN
jgi:prepilin-type N-terminal cleavage/methylation domain-containing protein